MVQVGMWVLPVIVVLIIGYGLLRGVKVFDCFLEGAKTGLETFRSLLPPLVGLVMAVGMLRESGGLAVLMGAMEPLSRMMGLPKEVMPLTVLSPLSGSGSITMFEQILKNCGPDSFAGRVASVMMGSSETTFYAVTVYYGAVGVKKTRHTVPAALCADLTCFLLSALTVRLLMGSP
ncbi:MAG TPA: spore maturation protein [Candidatus Fimivicinus intestinavium]|nr:spore maturation protein [Candidatus Fimivicinus intestinavium]